MEYKITKKKAQLYANETNKPTYITKIDNQIDFHYTFDNLNLPVGRRVVETVLPTTKEYLQSVIDRKIEDVINEMKALPYHTINGQANYFNASDVMDIVIQLRILQNRHKTIIVDAEKEYEDLARAMGGEIITINPASHKYFNPLDIASEDIDEEIKK